MTVIRDAFQRPVAPSDIVERLHQVDDRLNLRYVYYAHRDYSNVNMDERWAITLRWTESDKRRRMIQLGQMAEDADFDVLAYLPLDCSPEQAFSFFENGARQMVGTKDDIDRLLSRIHAFNDQQTKKVIGEELAKADEVIDANVTTLFEKEKGKIAKVYVK